MRLDTKEIQKGESKVNKQTITKPNCNLFNIWEPSTVSWCSWSCLHQRRWLISWCLDQLEDRGCFVALHKRWLIYFALSFIYLLAGHTYTWELWLLAWHKCPGHRSHTDHQIRVTVMHNDDIVYNYLLCSLLYTSPCWTHTWELWLLPWHECPGQRNCSWSPDLLCSLLYTSPCWTPRRYKKERAK